MVIAQPKIRAQYSGPGALGIAARTPRKMGVVSILKGLLGGRGEGEMKMDTKEETKEEMREKTKKKMKEAKKTTKKKKERKSSRGSSKSSSSSRSRSSRSRSSRSSTRSSTRRDQSEETLDRPKNKSPKSPTTATTTTTCSSTSSSPKKRGRPRKKPAPILPDSEDEEPPDSEIPQKRKPGRPKKVPSTSSQETCSSSSSASGKRNKKRPPTSQPSSPSANPTKRPSSKQRGPSHRSPPQSSADPLSPFKKPPYTVCKVPADGDCFYTCLQKCLPSHPTVSSQRSLVASKIGLDQLHFYQMTGETFSFDESSSSESDSNSDSDCSSSYASTKGSSSIITKLKRIQRATSAGLPNPFYSQASTLSPDSPPPSPPPKKRLPKNRPVKKSPTKPVTTLPSLKAYVIRLGSMFGPNTVLWADTFSFSVLSREYGVEILFVDVEGEEFYRSLAGAGESIKCVVVVRQGEHFNFIKKGKMTIFGRNEEWIVELWGDTS
ncbi:hypothetical protein TrST_g11343 [Triparma strigata]|uniref:Uncharacterized protein n=1 Tax=Triparma strigata TaxID=1606541 RepID=A0A9W7BFC6_9STRA|nr:hypothetical protein TrST_g11343 [Triparma strigata]